MREAMTPDFHCSKLLKEFNEKFPAKYLRGAIEHGGGLWKVPALNLIAHAKDEVLDQWSYLDSLHDVLLRICVQVMEALDEGNDAETDGDQAARFAQGLHKVLELLGPNKPSEAA